MMATVLVISDEGEDADEMQKGTASSMVGSGWSGVACR
jgi:hypothetical protein